MKRTRLRRMISAITALACTVSGLSFSATVGATSKDNEKSSASAQTVVSSANGNDPSKFSWDNATVYFLLTDRFKNGNTSNDHSYGRATDANGTPLSGWDTAPGTFHGGDFAGITEKINEGYFDDLGVNAIWLSAPYEQTHGYCDSGKGFAHYSYHGYYVLDYTNTDKNFGTPEEFQTLVDTAHSHGIRIVMDIVMNHSGYNTVLDMEQYNFGTLLPGASEYKYKLDGVSNVNKLIDFETSASDWGRWWGNDWIRSGLPGYSEDSNGSDYTMSLCGLPDFRTESTKSVSIPPILQTKWKQEGTYDTKVAKYGATNTVSGYLTTWLSEWVKTYGVDGFRCDTAKHVEKASWKLLKDSCVSALKTWRQNNPSKAGADWTDDFWMTGEAWDHGVGYDEYYTQGGFDSMINFDTCGGGSLGLNSLAGKYQGYADTINTKDDFNALSFVSSHDEVLTNQSQNMYYIGSAFLLLPGAVQIFYGDESNRGMFPGLSFDGYGGSGHSLRSDMNWNDMDTDLLEHWQKVGTFRNNHIAVGAGSNTSLTANSGVAFGRTYNKNGISDKVAGVVGTGNNSDITIDVSSLWEDGHDLMNAYDGSSDTVTDGKVTFNSGANGTILIQEPDGKPIVTLNGDTRFAGTQTITVNLKETDSAILSIDGGHKFIVHNGDKFNIGENVYDGDKIKISVYAENENGVMNKTSTFTRISQEQYDREHGEQPIIQVDSIVYVKSPNDGGVPTLYAWEGDSTALNGAWPGKEMTMDSETGMYKAVLDTNNSYNAIISKGGGSKSADLTDLYGKTVINASNYSDASVESTEKNPSSGGDTETGETIIRVKMADGSTPYLYVWNDKKKEFNGAWPGKPMTEKDEEGNFIFTASKGKVNCIVNRGSNQGQSSDITGLSGDVLLEVSENLSVKKTVTEAPASKFGTLKQEARSIKSLYSYEYTTASYNGLYVLLPTAEAVISKGEENATDEEIESILNQILTAKKSLVLTAPKLVNVYTGGTQIKGTAILGSTVTVQVNSAKYTATADEITGIWTVGTSAISSTDTITVSCSYNNLSSEKTVYNMSSGNVNLIPEAPKSPVDIYNEGGGDIGTPHLYGDVDLDGRITVRDATLIQKAVASVSALNTIQTKAAMVNKTTLSVKDATTIQKYAAKLINTFPAGTSFNA